MRSGTLKQSCGVIIAVFFAGAVVWSSTLVAQTKMANSASLPIGKYKLDMPISGVTGLTEFSQAEYSAYGRSFEGEKGYNAPPIDFLNRRGDVSLGTVGGKVYKVALFFGSPNKATVTDVSTELMSYCEKWLGKPSEQQDTVFIWDAADGNVVMQLGKSGTTYVVNLFETSRATRGFAPKR